MKPLERFFSGVLLLAFGIVCMPARAQEEIMISVTGSVTLADIQESLAAVRACRGIVLTIDPQKSAYTLETAVSERPTL